VVEHPLKQIKIVSRVHVPREAIPKGDRNKNDAGDLSSRALMKPIEKTIKTQKYRINIAYLATSKEETVLTKPYKPLKNSHETFGLFNHQKLGFVDEENHRT